MTIYKQGVEGEDESFETQPLPDELITLLDAPLVDYRAFAVVRVPRERVEALVDAIESFGLRVRVGGDQEIHGYSGAMDLDALGSRSDPWLEAGVPALEVAGLFWVQFGYPIKDEWRSGLRACATEIVQEVPTRALLVEAPSRESLVACAGVAGALTAVEPFRSIDRAGLAVLEHDGPVKATLRRGAAIDDLELPANAPITIGESPNGRVVVETRGAEIVRRLLVAPAVLAIAEVSEVPAAQSDERQALLAARQWNGLTGEATVPGTTYAGWLPAELGAGASQATIVFFDSGIDNAPTPPTIPQSPVSHVDLTGRLLGRYDIIPAQHGPVSILPDESGHGSVVAAIAVGAGRPAGTGGVGADGFHKGQGIAPHARYMFVNRFNFVSPSSCSGNGTTPNDTKDRVPNGHNWATSAESFPATIANHSWNEDAFYNPWVVRGFDRPAIDASDDLAGLQSLLPVVSAGNDFEGFHGAPPQPAATWVQPPGSAKNVLTVGSVDGWADGALETCVGNGYSDTHDGPFAPSYFSRWSPVTSGSATFNPGYGVELPRVKPDVMAPGWRVDGARPSPIVCNANPGMCGATTDQGSGAYSYGRGTSFATPVVSGAAALKTTWYRNRGIEPKASLLKAAIIATSDSLGPVVNGEVLCTDNDCRPSHKYGWGLINLQRLVAEKPDRFSRNEQVQFNQVGDFWRSVRLVPSDAELPVLIVLVWNDVPNEAEHHTGMSVLHRDLSLWVEDWNGSTPTPYFHAGNNFQQNILSLDTGWSHYFGLWHGGGNPVADTRNTVEAVFMQPSTRYEGSGGFRIVVIDEAHPPADLTLPSHFGPQRFSVYAWNARLP